MLLAEFFAPRQGSSTGAMDAYSNMGKFCGVEHGPKRWTGAIKPDWRPSVGGYHAEFAAFLVNCGPTLRERCRPLASGTPLEQVTDNDADWQLFLENAGKDFHDAVQTWENDYHSLVDAWIEIPRQPSQGAAQSEKYKANSTRYQIRRHLSHHCPPSFDTRPQSLGYFTQGFRKGSRHKAIPSLLTCSAASARLF
jgi:hypothetical protein